MQLILFPSWSTRVHYFDKITQCFIIIWRCKIGCKNPYYCCQQSDCDNAYAGTALEITLEQITYYDAYGYGGDYKPSGIQLWTVPETGTFNIEVHGAKGGSNYNGYNGGNGAKMYGEFDLSAGDVLKILVGQKGGGSYNYNYGYYFYFVVINFLNLLYKYF